MRSRRQHNSELNEELKDLNEGIRYRKHAGSKNKKLRTVLVKKDNKANSKDAVNPEEVDRMQMFGEQEPAGKRKKLRQSAKYRGTVEDGEGLGDMFPRKNSKLELEDEGSLADLLDP